MNKALFYTGNRVNRTNTSDPATNRLFDELTAEYNIKIKYEDQLGPLMTVVVQRPNSGRTRGMWPRLVRGRLLRSVVGNAAGSDAAAGGVVGRDDK